MPTTPAAVIVDAVRSPLAKGRAPREGRPGGALSGLHPAGLLGQTIKALLDRNQAVDPATVDDVITGCVSQASEQAGPIGRWAWLGAGLAEGVPACTIDRRCGSSQQCVEFAAMGIIAGVYEIVVACGVESMSRVPMGTARMGADIYGPATTARYAPGLVAQGISAELIAARHGIDRTRLDEFAARSHATAERADFSNEMVPIEVVGEDGSTTIVDFDEGIRPGTTADKLGALAAAFENAEMKQRFPEIEWRVTAGNSSQLTDGASALLIMSEDKASQLGLPPRARIHAMAVASDDPITMLTGPIPATEKVLARSGMTIEQFDQFEVNEAFASVPLRWLDHFEADPEKLNPRGGAIALGHPLGASGGRLMASLLNGLEQTGGRWGLQTMCEAGGMANATIIERL